jgi:glutamyl-tRNA synthetase
LTFPVTPPLLERDAEREALAGLLRAAADGRGGCALVRGPAGRRLAKRHGAVTLREVAPARALMWMAASLGLRGATPREMLAGFSPEALPRSPTIFAPG